MYFDSAPMAVDGSALSSRNRAMAWSRREVARLAFALVKDASCRREAESPRCEPSSSATLMATS